MMSSPSPYFYLVTGFHRSGTSLLAQTLLQNGMHMGDELMGATFSNPLGHAEDMPVVRLHDRIYQLNGCDWRYHDSSPLIKPTWLSNYLETYIEKRTDTPHGFSGVKDPRAVHFLNEWHAAGEGSIKYVFIYRHWRTAAHSLLNRHSRHLINSAHDIEKHKLNFSFWQQSDLAYKMWLSANQHILSFIEAHPQDCILLSQQGFISQSDTTLDWAKKIALSPALFIPRNFKRELLSDSAPLCSESVLDSATVARLDAVYENLQQRADLPAKNNQTQSPRPLHKLVTVHTEHSHQSTENIFDKAVFDLSDLSFSELSGVMLELPLAQRHYRYYWEALTRENAAPDDYFGLAKVAHSQGEWIVARVLKIRAILNECIARGVQPFDLSNWLMFVNEQAYWRMLKDEELANANPFSLRARGTLPKAMQKSCAIKDIRAIPEVLHSLQNATEQTRESSLSTLLLCSSWQTPEYQLIAQAAQEYGLTHIFEFVLFKHLRLAETNNDVSGKRLILNQLEKVYAASGIETLQSALGSTLRGTDLSLTQDSKHYSPQDGQMDIAQTLSYRLLRDGLSGNETRKPTGPPKRHRFAVLPHMLSYQKVLAHGYDDIAFGLQLDRLNRRLCFLAKDNQRWLQKGLDALTPPAATSLADAIQTHWLKLWPTAISEYLYGTKCPETEASVNPGFTDSQHNKCLVIYDIDSSALTALAALLVEKVPQCRVHLMLTTPISENIQAIVSQLKLAGVDIDYSIEEVPVSMSYLLEKWQSMEQFEWFAAMPVKEQPTLIERRKQLMRWYSMLGYEFDLNTSLKVPAGKSAMLIPSYAPDDLESLQKRPLFYPDAEIFWINRKGIECINNISAEDSNTWMIKMLQALKTQGAHLACMHQFFLKYFE